MRWKETEEKKETYEAVMADRRRGVEWYEGLKYLLLLHYVFLH
jgi:hypothetical protein